MIKTGIFISSHPIYAKKSSVRMDMLILVEGYQNSNYPSVDLIPVRLGIFRGDSSNWIRCLGFTDVSLLTQTGICGLIVSYRLVVPS